MNSNEILGLTVTAIVLVIVLAFIANEFIPDIIKTEEVEPIESDKLPEQEKDTTIIEENTIKIEIENQKPRIYNFTKECKFTYSSDYMALCERMEVIIGLLQEDNKNQEYLELIKVIKELAEEKELVKSEWQKIPIKANEEKLCNDKTEIMQTRLINGKMEYRCIGLE